VRKSCITHHHHPSDPSLTHTQNNSPITITITTSPLQHSRFLKARCNDNKFATAASGDSAPAPALDWKVAELVTAAKKLS
jgi:hypothetical protein